VKQFCECAGEMYSLEQRVIVRIRDSWFFYGFGIMYIKWNENGWNYIFYYY
jgi:hypothetical protein